MKNLALSLAFLAVSCTKAGSTDSMQSNFAQVRLGDGVITDSATDNPYTGPVVARGSEIGAVGKMVFAGTPLLGVADLDASGLILELPVKNGVPEGKAILHADLSSKRLAAEVARRKHFAAAIAAKIAPTIKIGEATFVAGKLEGQVVVYAPDGKSGKLLKLAEATFAAGLPDGVAREYYPGKAQVRHEVTFENGERLGAQRTFYDNGTLESEVILTRAGPTGTITEYYKSGKKRAVSTYKDGQRVGTATWWYPNGQIEREAKVDPDGFGDEVTEWLSNGQKKDDLRHGEIVDYYATGAVRHRMTYKDGVPHGAYETLYKDGQKWEAGVYEMGKRVGPHKKWYKSGVLALDATWVGGALDGDYKRWYASGQVWEQASYTAGKRVGAYKKFWKNGQIAHDYVYKNGRIEGEYKTFYATGERWGTGLFVGGKPKGAIKRFFRDGRLGFIMNHENGRPHGEFKRWYADGKPRLEATYNKGKLDGEFKNWLEDGSVYELATYKNGTKVQTTLEPQSAGFD